MLVVAAAVAVLNLKMDRCLAVRRLVEAPMWEYWSIRGTHYTWHGISGGEWLDGVLVDLQDEVMDDGHLCPSPVQQLKVGMPDPLER